MATSLLRSLLTIAELGLSLGSDVSFSHTTEARSKSSSLSGVLYQQGSHDDPYDLRRIEYLTLTVPDLDRAASFYEEVLGAHEINFCQEEEWCRDGAVRISGDSHQAAFFGRDRDDSVSKPDISAAGDWEALSRFFLFRNALVQLLKFSKKEPARDRMYFDLWEPLTSPVWLAQAHICFMVEEGLDANMYIADVETRSLALNMPEVKFNRPVPQETGADRNKVPQSQYANKAVGSAFDGLNWAYWKGHVGEQYEIYQMERTIKRGVGRAYCERGAVSTAFVDDDRARGDDKEEPLGHKLHGVYQYGFRTADLHRAVGFYAEVLGGSLISYPTHGLNIAGDDSAHWMILANETLAAYEYARKEGIDRDEAMRRFGVPNISSAGENRLDHRFVLFDNFVVETLEYTDGLSFGAEGFDPQLSHGSSLAYIGTVTAAFGLSETTTWESYLPALRRRLDRRGFRKVELPPGHAEFEPEHPYSGLEYSYMKGPDGEAIALTRMTGRFREALHQALLATGAVSTMFEDTNPYAKGEMERFCAYAQFDDRYEAFVV